MSRRVEAQAGLILATYKRQPTIFLRELVAGHGLQTSTSGLSRFFARHAITREKGQSTQASKTGRT